MGTARFARAVHARLVSALALLLALELGSLASAQSCPSMQFENLSTTQRSRYKGCCLVFADAYDTNSCSMSSDWPSAVKDVCAIVNQQFLTCAGLVFGTDAQREHHIAIQNAPGCEVDCGRFIPVESLVCGISDGCGGTCTAANLCGLVKRRPEFFVVLFTP